MNVKILIVKLIMNCSSILEPYSAVFLVPMIKVIVQYMKNGSRSNVGCTIDGFVVDALISILSWNNEAPPKVKICNAILPVVISK